MRRIANRFTLRLKDHEKANLDVDDIISELVTILIERDDKFDPNRGKYITFASTVAKIHLNALRDKSHTVESPLNSASRMKKYDQDKTDGKLNLRTSKTSHDIPRSCEATVPIETVDIIDDREESPLEILEQCEYKENLKKAILKEIRKLKPLEAVVISRLFGLNGNHEESIWEIAFELSKTAREIKDIRDSALAKLRKKLKRKNK